MSTLQEARPVRRPGHSSGSLGPTTQEAAEALKEQVLAAPGANKAWPKITTVLKDFDERALTPEARTRIAGAFREVGVICEPPFDSLEARGGTVCLSVPGVAPATPSELFEATIIEGGSWRKEDSEGLTCGDGQLLWIDLDVMAGDQRSIERALAGVCQGISPSIVEDLYLIDLTPKIHVYEQEGARAVSAVSLAPKEPNEDEGHGGGIGSVGVRMVEIVAGNGWLITAWHRERVLVGTDENLADGAVPGEARAKLRKDVEARWRELHTEGETPTPGDLGILILEDITSTYEAARTELSAWLDSWELDFYRVASEDDPKADKMNQRSLIDLRSIVGEVKRYVAPLDAPRKRVKTHWFHGVSEPTPAEGVDESVDSTLEALDLISNRIRGGFDLVQLQLAQASDRRSKKVQSNVEKITIFGVVPATVAAIFGANTWLPGGNDPHAAASFEIMIAVMVVLITMVYLLLRSARH